MRNKSRLFEAREVEVFLGEGGGGLRVILKMMAVAEVKTGESMGRVNRLPMMAEKVVNPQLGVGRRL